MEMSHEDKNFRRYILDDLFIGKGAFGDVFGPCDWEGKKCAIKKRWFTDAAMEDTKIQLSACDKWMSLHHKRLITVYDISVETHAVYMMMEYALGKSLKDVLSARKSQLPLNILNDWGTQTAEGMAYLHENNIVHRDLKSPNILIMEADTSSNPYNKTLKITDFDQIREHDGTKAMSMAGTCAWAAPEVFKEGNFSKASDVWSYGVVLWEILTRNVPFKGVADHTIIAYALNGTLNLEIPDSCPDIKSVIKSCLSNERTQRPSFDEILLELQRSRLRTVSYEDKNFRRFVSDNLFISKGSFGEVFGPCDLTGRKCAIKKRWIHMEDTDELLSSWLKWMSLHHNSLITFYDVSLEPPAIYVSMEYANGGSLKEVLSACKSELPLDILKDWGIQIAEGMAHLHKNNIVHRDLKSRKIVMMEADAPSNPYNKTLKITGFDQIREHDRTKTMTFAGTYAWTAPEVLTEWKFSKASDVWSYGVVLWEILTRNLPYKDVANQKFIIYALHGLLKLEIPDSCPEVIKYMLNRCLSNERAQRPSFDEILSELQGCHSAAGEDPKTNDLQKKDNKQLKSYGSGTDQRRRGECTFL